MRRYPSPSASSFSFGPGPVSTALKGIIIANVVMFFATTFFRTLVPMLGLVPALVVRDFWVWQVATYMFLHGGLFHILFNMLALWMFGTELERLWGTRYFLKFYFVSGIGAGILTVLFSLLPLSMAGSLYHANVIGASGAIYGLLLAYALYFPDRPILLYFLFPIPARYFVMIMGAIAFYASDTMIAWARFLGPVPGGRISVMVTYHLGQLALSVALDSGDAEDLAGAHLEVETGDRHQPAVVVHPEVAD